MESGTKLGPCENTGPLGKDGMGEVYQATDTHLNRQVAIKVLPTGCAQETELLARFERLSETYEGERSHESNSQHRPA